MNRYAPTQTHQQNPTATPTAGGLLQRKCACGNHTMAGGECSECSKKKGLGLQAKLKVNEPGDIYEQEADRIADQVMATPTHSKVSGAPPRIQRFSGASNGQMDAAPASVDQALASPGWPLEPVLRQDMEQRFGYDFSRVRVHSGAVAEQSAHDVNANAYTVGHDVVFGAGSFAPGTHEGRRLIAHELTHVVQQSGADGIRVDQSNEKRGLSGLSPISPSSPPVVQRDLADLAQIALGPVAQIALGGDRPRPLTPFEAAEAHRVFGSALKTEGVRISEGGLMTVRGFARTLPDRIYFPDGSFQGKDFIPYLIHELTHVWQYQQGADIPGMIYEALVANYDYGKEDGLREAWKNGQAFDEFTTEQQGDILSDYYTALLPGGDVSAYQGFVDQVRTGRAKEHRYPTVERLPLGTLDEAKGRKDYRAKTEAEIIRQLRLPMSADDARAIARAHRLLELFRSLTPYWSGTYRERIAVRRSDDELVNLLFSQISRDTRARIFTVLGVEPRLWK